MVRRRIWLWVTSLVTIGLGLGGLAYTIDRYGPVNPTEPGWDVAVINDTASAVTMSSDAESLRVPAGGSEIFVAPGPGVLRFSLRVRSANLGTLTCLPVKLSKHHRVTASVSEAMPC